MAEQFAGNHDVVVGINDTLSVGGDRRVDVGRNLSSSAQANQTLVVGKDLAVTVGKNLRFRAADSLELVCGGASILMKKDGTIVIKGKDVLIDASGKVNVKSSADLVIKGSKVLQN